MVMLTHSLYRMAVDMKKYSTYKGMRLQQQLYPLCLEPIGIPVGSEIHRQI